MRSEMAGEIDPSIHALAEAAGAFLRTNANRLHLSSAQIASIRPFAPVEAWGVPALDTVCNDLPPTSPDTLPLCRAVQAAARQMHWRRTYSEADGFPRAFLDTYGWFDLAGPEGPYTADNLRIMFGYWGPGLHYPDHSHVQEEHYCVLAGSAWFRLDNEPFRRLGPGDFFHTPPGAVHAAEMRDEPLLAMAIWRADDLSVRIHLTDADRNVQVD